MFINSGEMGGGDVYYTKMDRRLKSLSSVFIAKKWSRIKRYGPSLPAPSPHMFMLSAPIMHTAVASGRRCNVGGGFLISPSATCAIIKETIVSAPICNPPHTHIQLTPIISSRKHYAKTKEQGDTWKREYWQNAEIVPRKSLMCSAPDRTGSRNRQ